MKSDIKHIRIESKMKVLTIVFWSISPSLLQHSARAGTVIGREKGIVVSSPVPSWRKLIKKAG